MTESQFKKTVQAVCIGAVTVFFIMVLILIVLFSQKATLNKSNQKIREQIAKAEQLKDDYENAVEYYRTIEYIELYARENLGMLKKGEQKFRAE